jgi:hypothetical protein
LLLSNSFTEISFSHIIVLLLPHYRNINIFELSAHNKLTEVMRVIPCTDNACAYQDDGVCVQNRAVSGDGTKPECAYFVGKSGRGELRADCALAAKSDSPADATAESDL